MKQCYVWRCCPTLRLLATRTVLKLTKYSPKMGSTPPCWHDTRECCMIPWRRKSQRQPFYLWSFPENGSRGHLQVHKSSRFRKTRVKKNTFSFKFWKVRIEKSKIHEFLEDFTVDTCVHISCVCWVYTEDSSLCQGLTLIRVHMLLTTLPQCPQTYLMSQWTFLFTLPHKWEGSGISLLMLLEWDNKLHCLPSHHIRQTQSALLFSTLGLSRVQRSLGRNS